MRLNLIGQEVHLEAGVAEPDAAAPRLRVLAYTGQPVRLQGWPNPVIVDLSGLVIPPHLPVQHGHDWRAEAGIGHVVEFANSGDRLEVVVAVSRETDAARDVLSSLRRGYPWQASIGAAVLEKESIGSNQMVEANGKSWKGPLTLVKRAELVEVSIVERGADPDTAVAVAAQGHGGQVGMEDKGMQDGAAVDMDVKAMVDAAREERQRRTRIVELTRQALAAGAPEEEVLRIGQEAIEAHWPPERAELELLRATRPKPVNVVPGSAVSENALQVAFCRVLGVRDDRLLAEYGEAALEQGDKLASEGIRSIISRYASRYGVNLSVGNYWDNLRTLHRRAAVEASYSSFNLPGLLGAAANKFLLQAFTAIDAIYPFVAQQKALADFKPHRMYRLSVDGSVTEVPAGGDLPLGRLSEFEASNQLATHGMVVALPRQAIVNDDLGAFQDILRMLARKLRLAVERRLCSLIMESTDNFYTSARGNRLTTNPLSLDNISKAVAAMFRLKDDDGNPLYLRPTMLVIPPSLEAFARQLVESQTLTGGTNTVPVVNPWSGAFRVLSSPFFEDASIPGSSATTWYMVANPEIVPAWQVGYLGQRQAPTLESDDMPFNTLGMQWRAYFDFGVARIDYRGANKSTA